MRREPLSAEPVLGDQHEKQASTSKSALPTLEALVQLRGHSRDPDTQTDGVLNRTSEQSHKEHDEKREHLQNQAGSRLKDRFTAVPRGPSSVIQQTPKVLVLDLDETLIHSTSRPMSHAPGSGLLGSFGFGRRTNKGAGHMVEVVLGGRSTLYHVYKRPFVDYFLRKVRCTEFSAWAGSG